MSFEENFSEIIRVSSVARELIANCGIRASPADNQVPPVEGEFDTISRIILRGKVLSARVSYAFNARTANKLAANYLGQPLEQTSDDQGRDFLREFANVHAGFIQSIFGHCGLNLGISLPLVLAYQPQTPIAPAANDNPVQVIPWTISILGETIWCFAEVNFANKHEVEVAMPRLKSRLDSEVNAIRKDKKVEFL